ncbi:MAG: hypothetical protein DRQ55_17015 [Planctomycetota bacterium]|nr:MAG: hypothetical protein DRQ55_17015 [Planctomycetota bacterium]
MNTLHHVTTRLHAGALAGLSGLALCLGAATASSQDALPQIELQPFPGAPLPGLTAPELDRFEKGRLEFEHVLSNAEGLGPVFNDSSCAQCHALPLAGGFSSSAVTRFGKAASGPNPFDPLDALGGSLLQDQTTDGGCAESVPPEADVTTFRTTPHLFGLGLVEAISDGDLLLNETTPPHASVAGVAHMVTPLEGGGLRVGRFGWKAQVPTVLTFSADASLNEMGLTNRFVGTENAPNGDLGLLAACDAVADPEDGPDGEGFDRIDRHTDFQRFLAQPPQTPRNGMTGAALFTQVSCDACHVVEFTTGATAEAALSGVTFRPFSDFLLHEVIGDGIVQGTGTEMRMRTAPLWGLGQRAGVGLLHDGSATGGTAEVNIDTAILAHDNEAAFSSAAYQALSGAEQDQLVAFLMSLGRAEFDIEGNSTVDEIDWFFLQAFGHFTGPDLGGGAFFGPDDESAVADVDQDGDFDLVDFGYMQRAFTGALP